MKNVKKYNHVLGIDIGGATRTGIALFSNDENKMLYTNTIFRRDVKNNVEHRKNIENEILKIYNNYGIDILIFESIRLFNVGRIQLQTILSQNKVQTTIVNAFSDKFDIYSVDVRSWKAKVLGTAKADKYMSINFINKKFPDIDLLDKINHPKLKTIDYELNHDLADACAISTCLKLDYNILKEKNKMNWK